MIMNVYLAKDELVGFYGISEMQNDAVAIRNFKFAVDDTKTLVHANKSDFALYKVGSYDSNTGKFDLLVTPELVTRGSDFADV